MGEIERYLGRESQNRFIPEVKHHLTIEPLQQVHLGKW